MLDDWLRVVPARQLHIQLWNEPNVPPASGGTGFGDTEAGMLRLNSMFTEGYWRIKERAPEVRVGFPPLAPRYRDCWFPGDASGRYYLHGTSGCRGTETMTASDRSAALSSGPCFGALTMADEVYAHTFVHNRDGVLSCWNHAAYGRRYEALRYWWPNKPMWITEYGYPNKQLLEQAGASRRCSPTRTTWSVRAPLSGARRSGHWETTPPGEERCSSGWAPFYDHTRSHTASGGRCARPTQRYLPCLTSRSVPAIGFPSGSCTALNSDAALYKAAKQEPTPDARQRRVSPAELPISLPDSLPADIVCQVFRDPWMMPGRISPDAHRRVGAFTDSLDTPQELSLRLCATRKNQNCSKPAERCVSLGPVSRTNCLARVWAGTGPAPTG